MNIKSVIFDFGNVICFPPLAEHIAEAAADGGLPVDEFLRALWADRLEYDRGMDPLEYWRAVGTMTGRPFDDELIARMVKHEIRFWSRFDDRVLRWIDDLRAGGVKVAILSNLPVPIGGSLRATPGFLEHFDHVTFSYELGLVKPEAAIYEDAIRGVGVRPEEALFLDDREDNVLGARAAGLHAQTFTTWEEFVRETPARYGLARPQ